MDVVRLVRGLNFTHREMKFDAIDGNLIDAVPQVVIPVYFFTGRYDYTDPYILTEEYARRLEAPRKELVWFEESAHFPFLEEPDNFARQMGKVVLDTRQ